jgi:hypothetical protein
MFLVFDILLWLVVIIVGVYALFALFSLVIICYGIAKGKVVVKHHRKRKMTSYEMMKDIEKRFGGKK